MLKAGDEEIMGLGSAADLTVVRKRGAEGGFAESARPFMISTFIFERNSHLLDALELNAVSSVY